jgi:SAM-dependent methyltransferase
LKPTPLICPHCQGELEFSPASVECTRCRRTYPRRERTIDFAPDSHYDTFTPADTLHSEHVRGLALEVEGSRRRIEDFYLPLIRTNSPDAERVLDSGCGNGVSVEALRAQGYDAWGNELSELRAWQWSQSCAADFLVVASSLLLPFRDGHFDVVISSGVIEHIGVVESPHPTYSVRALPDRDAQRLIFVRELARVLKPGGSIYIDCPNGAFPVDFWHNDVPGKPRFHSVREPFLPTFAELRRIAREAVPGCHVAAISPYKRLQFKQAAHHSHGRLLAPAVNGVFRAMTWRPFRSLAATPLNPFLVVSITKS